MVTTAVSSVTNMNYMFYEASSFNQTICGWDLSGVSQTIMMFYGSSGSVIETCSPSFLPTLAPAPTATKPSDDGPDDGSLQSISDSVVDLWSATKDLLEEIWGIFF